MTLDLDKRERRLWLRWLLNDFANRINYLTHTDTDEPLDESAPS